ncbi:unnamed protein product [Hymenolepis diminuta]|uniref:Tctex1 domain-containing protein 1 n=1 Tax=Hymenolepis diminuta TaxID=6216 RepID=A0A564Z733_HYMDI|nr:unnamed protein product [Hymenolepis diminuta]
MRLSIDRSNSVRDSRRIKPGQSYQIAVTHFDSPSRLVIPRKVENTYQLEPNVIFPQGKVEIILAEVVDGFLQDVKYDPDKCREASILLSDTIQARIKSLHLRRYKIITQVTISARSDYNFMTINNCLWEPAFDKCVTHEFCNNSIFATAYVFAIYQP